MAPHLTMGRPAWWAKLVVECGRIVFHGAGVFRLCLALNSKLQTSQELISIFGVDRMFIKHQRTSKTAA